jgi:hypothetical protein
MRRGSASAFYFADVTYFFPAGRAVQNWGYPSATKARRHAPRNGYGFRGAQHPRQMVPILLLR